MHPYSTDSSERLTVPLLLAVLSIILAWCIAAIVAAWKIPIPWWLDVPAVWGLYALLWKVFDSKLWAWPLFRAIGLVKVPDLRGTWRGHGVSSYREAAERKQFDATVVIRQQWTRLSVVLATDSSRSQSLIGALMLDDAGGPTLSYEYRSDPSVHAAATMHSHRGMARLGLVSPGKLEGEYYTGRDRQNYGTLSLQKVE